MSPDCFAFIHDSSFKEKAVTTLPGMVDEMNKMSDKLVSN